MGNVNRVFKNGILINRYSYDCLGRIIKEDNKELDKSIVYCYDNNGNILNKYTYKYSTSDLDDKEYILDRYKYNNELLVSINDINYEYDLLGNPIKIGNNILIWNGYLLEKYGNNIFKYNSNGLRIKKNDIEFIYDSNDNLIYSSDGLTFIYDDNKVIGFIYNNNYYFYKYDLLGNINYLIDSNGNIIVKYKYDSYGNHKIFDNNDNEISDEHNIGYINPIRYKGYYYDNETGLYYLKARYYDPKASRFISPDSIEYLDPESVNGLNLYCYCMNNPIMYADPSGHSFILAMLIGAGIGLVVGLGSQLASDVISNVKKNWLNFPDWKMSSWQTYVGAGLGGAIGGALTPFFGTVATGFFTGVSSTAITMGLSNVTGASNYSLGEIFATSLLIGSVSGITAGILDNIKIPGINSGRGSLTAVSKQINTKLVNGTIKKVSFKTIIKMASLNAIYSAPFAAFNGLFTDGIVLSPAY